MNYTQLLLLSYFISIGILFVAVGIATYTLYLIEQRKAVDGLEILREWLIRKNESIMAIGITAILALTARFYITNIDIARLFIGIVILAYSIGFLYFAILNFRIWTGGYKR